MTTQDRWLLRALDRSDELIWRTLWQDYLDFYGTDLDAAVTDTTWHRLIGELEPMRGIVTCVEDRPIGFCHIVLHRSTWSVEPQAYLQDLFVSSIHRRAGVGRALLQAAIDYSGSIGSSRLTWLTKVDNFTARALYDRDARLTDFVQYSAPT